METTRATRKCVNRLSATMPVLLAGFIAAPGAADGPPPPPPPIPDVIELAGIVRDFREVTAGGHPDFEAVPAHGYGHYHGNIAYTLGEDGKPAFVGGGHKVTSQWRDSAGRPIFKRFYNSGAGDTAGTQQSAVDTGGVASAASFDQWFRDELGVNMSNFLDIALVRKPNGTYVFDAATDPLYEPLGGFFPIEHELFGNPGGNPDRNFHFTFELHATFVYDADAGQFFRFVGDDDVWDFIDGQLVIDIGGVHTAVEQYLDLNRLPLPPAQGGLGMPMVDGEVYNWDFFFAERHRTQSKFRITTNLPLESSLPTVSLIAD